ncbi:hypothetical protein [Wolbachia endosymbiont of Tetranychus urticae]|uniref:hypothetical protein n=1 Tax=Wolbachia endosymbiont of Tetranychus urticae TaxID=169184 RepID=UPI003978ED39
MKDNEKFKELIKNNEILLFKVVKGEKIDNERSSVILRSINTNTDIIIDATKFYIAKDVLTYPSNDYVLETECLYFIHSQYNEPEKVYVTINDNEFNDLFFVMNRSSDLNLKNNFYVIPNFDNYREYSDYSKWLCEKCNEPIEAEVIRQFEYLIPIIPNVKKQSVTQVINTSLEQKTSVQQDEGNNLQSEAAVTLHKDNSKSEIVNNNTEETKSPISSLLDGLKAYGSRLFL